jgi:hypothetical protein
MTNGDIFMWAILTGEMVAAGLLIKGHENKGTLVMAVTVATLVGGCMTAQHWAF